MPTNKKKKRGTTTLGQQDNGTMVPVVPPEVERRVVPEMAVSVESMKAAMLAVPIIERSRTCQRFVKAYELVDSIKDDHAGTSTGGAGVNDNNDIADLIRDRTYMRHCASLIRAVVLTDARVYLPMHFPLPSCWYRVTRLPPLKVNGDAAINDDNDDDKRHVAVELVNVDANSFVVLLATAIVIMASSLSRPVLQLVHELRGHAVLGGPEYWDNLNVVDDEVTGDDDDPLDGATLRFALATVGIKAGRRLYREKSQRQLIPETDPVGSRFLLNSIEALARDQCRFRPWSGVGYRNLGWLARESVSKRGKPEMEGAAECLAMMRESYRIADRNGDDFVSAAGRIDAAGCLVFGAEGTVGCTVLGNKKGVAHRDMRSEAIRRRESIVPLTESQVPISFKVSDATAPNVSGATAGIMGAIIENEKRRIETRVPPTVLEPGEKRLVAWWDIVTLWNEAVTGPYDSLSRWAHGHIVYGETFGWDLVVGFLKHCTETQKLEARAYAFAPETTKFSSGGRDKGMERITCARCGKVDENNPQCSRCKVVCYCSQVCQRADWKRHKPRCKPIRN